MPLTATQQHFTKLYLASFLRAPELSGLNYWVNEAAIKGVQLTQGIIFSLPAVTDIYPASMTDTQFVEAMYQNLFGRASDDDGMSYWTNEIAALRSTYTAQGSANADFEARGQLVMNMINAGLGAPDGTDGKAYIENRLAVAEYVAEQQLEQGREISAAFLLETFSHVDADDANVTTGKNAITNLFADETAPSLLSLGATSSAMHSGTLISDIWSSSDYYKYNMIQDAEGHLIVPIQKTIGDNFYSFSLARLNVDGALDTSFGGGDGLASVDFSMFTESANSVLQQSDGKLVLAGDAYDTNQQNGLPNQDFALARFNPDGTLDSSFGNAGKVTTSFASGHHNIANSTIQQSDGKLVAAGYEYSTYEIYTGGDLPRTYFTYHGFSLARYNPDGSLDASFGTNGTITTDFAGKGGTGYSLIQQADGKLVVAGNSNEDFALARYNLDGSLDGGFGANGLVTTDFAGGYDSGYSLIQQGDGKLLLAGSAKEGNKTNFALARYNPDGSLDTSFGEGDGKITTDFLGGDNSGTDLIQLADGKFLLAGSAYEPNNGYNNFALARYNADGTLDTLFGGGDGKVTTDVAGEFDSGHSLIQQADGKLLVAGATMVGFHLNFALTRYNPDGTLDTSFGNERLSAALGLTSDEDSSAGLYDGSNALVGSTLSLSSNTAAKLEVSAQASVTQTSLRLTDDAGNSNTGPAVTLGTTGNDTFSLGCAGYLFGFDGDDDLIGSSGADVFIGGKGVDRIWLGSDSAVDRVFFGVDGLNYHDYPMDYDVIYDMALGSGGDVLDLSTLNLGEMSLNATIFNANPSASTNISGQVVRLLDQTSDYPDGFLPRPSDTELMQALNDGRYANLDMDANSSALILVNWVIDHQHIYNNTTFLSRVESSDTGEIDSVELIGMIRNVDVNLWAADNFAF